MVRSFLGTALLTLMVSVPAVQAQQAVKQAEQEAPTSWQDVIRMRKGPATPISARLGPAALGLAAPVAEAEPNNDSGTATPMAIGDVASGVIIDATDVDFYSFAATAGQPVELEVEAFVNGSDLDGLLTLYDTDGTTVLAQNDDYMSVDPRILIEIPANGTYFAAVHDSRSRERGSPTCRQGPRPRFSIPRPGQVR